MRFTIAFLVDSVPFGPGEISGTKSLGGSESACLGTARGLAQRGHAVHVFATKLDPECQGVDQWGVTWHRAEDLDRVSRIFEWDVFCSLRMPLAFSLDVRARLRILWNQDLMNAESFKNTVMAYAWAIDRFVYVSEFHKAQWADWIPEIAPFGYVTKNGYDPSLVPVDAVKDPNRIIHISRPERGLRPILQMWEKVREANPWATLHICRYSSMYDADGWGEICKDFDRQVEALNKTVGGITYLGELGKADLYKAISEAAVMWYPGVPSFAETSCLASIEAQACGTPFVGSFKGALPESVPNGVLIQGDAFTPEYQAQSVAAVVEMLKDCARNGFRYRQLQGMGKKHVEAYTFASVAAEWEQWLEETFRTRYAQNRLQVMHQMVHFDDQTAALRIADEILLDENRTTSEDVQATFVKEDATRVIKGLEQTSEQYAAHALDPITELRHEGNGRLRVVATSLDGCTDIIDVACGNGAFALGIAEKNPNIRVLGIDYAEANIAAARKAAEELGLGTRCEFVCAPVWDFNTNAFSEWWNGFAQFTGRRFDGLWCGEFVEHVADCTALVDGLEAVLQPDAKVLYTCPSGPMIEYQGRGFPLHRGHVHHFAHEDIQAVFGPKRHATFDMILWPEPTPNGNTCGNWIIAYRAGDAKAGARPYEHRALTCRPRQRLSVGILAHNSEHNILQCIDSVWGIADEIVIGDAGSYDTTRKIVEGIRKVRVVDVTPVTQHPDGFAGSRNEVLQSCVGERFMWIDTDEVLAGMQALPKYLDSVVYQGYAIFQNHLQLDGPMHHDTPVRVFSRRPDIQFYGCVHEQPQMGDCNGDIVPALQIHETQIAHTGYLVEGVRRQKMAQRNFPLLIKDNQRFPDRKLGKVLILRDLVNMADYAAEEAGYEYPPVAVDYLKRAIGLFEQLLSDPANRYHALGRPYYEKALRALKVGIEVEVALACGPGGIQQGKHAKMRRMWIREADDLKTIMDWQVGEIVGKMKPPPLRVEPLKQRQQVSA